MPSAQNDIEELITKSLAGETSQVEENRLAEWLKKDSANQKIYAQLKKVFEEGSKFYTSSPEVNAINVEEEWSHFMNTLPELQKDKMRSLVPEKHSFSWVRIAAALVLMAVSGFVVNYFLSRNSEVIFETAGNSLPVTLPDGSQIILNSNSKLSYSKSFGEGSREVALQGEAFFEVAHDTIRPFVISAGVTQVEVLGTSFNVSAYDDQKEIAVTVATGKVKFSVPKTKEEIKLTAGQRGQFNKTDFQLAGTINTDVNFLSWKTKKLIFIENDLQSVVQAINKAYGSTITISTDLPATCIVTVSFEGQTLEAVLNVLKSTLNLTYQEREGRIEIISAGC